jgi:hypothetical protein
MLNAGYWMQDTGCWKLGLKNKCQPVPIAIVNIKGIVDCSLIPITNPLNFIPFQLLQLNQPYIT